MNNTVIRSNLAYFRTREVAQQLNADTASLEDLNSVSSSHGRWPATDFNYSSIGSNF